ncbi:MAG: hypothetical protein M1826_007328 [Phylliscum demangeonii]|nr:MAG: hypothetical protein M1826_007328 [Phylliscum demangeonii]
MPRRGARLSADQLSYHPASVARRAREHALAVHRADSADRSALSRALQRLRRMPGFEARSAAVRSDAEARTRAALMDRRWAEHRSAEWVLDHGDDDEEDHDEVLADHDGHEPAANPAEGVAAVDLQATAAAALVAPVVAVAVAAPAGSASSAGAGAGAAPAPLPTSLSRSRSEPGATSGHKRYGGRTAATSTSHHSLLQDHAAPRASMVLLAHAILSPNKSQVLASSDCTVFALKPAATVLASQTTVEAFIGMPSPCGQTA